MPVTVACTSVIFTVLYFKKAEAKFLKEAILPGVVFLAVSIVVHLLTFSKGPMAMPVVDYAKDIGFTYLIIPAITIGVGYVLRVLRHITK